MVKQRRHSCNVGPRERRTSGCDPGLRVHGPVRRSDSVRCGEWRGTRVGPPVGCDRRHRLPGVGCAWEVRVGPHHPGRARGSAGWCIRDATWPPNRSSWADACRTRASGAQNGLRGDSRGLRQRQGRLTRNSGAHRGRAGRSPPAAVVTGAPTRAASADTTVPGSRAPITTLTCAPCGPSEDRPWRSSRRARTALLS